jgi:hypothetical protein
VRGMRGCIALLALVAGCGGSKEAVPTPVPGKTLQGATETGMRLKVDTFLDPADDSRLERIDDWRDEQGYREVDFHRVTADNSAGPAADSGRTVRFAPDAARLAAGAGIEARFSCDVVEFEWLPAETSDADGWNALRRDLCADGPPKPNGIAAGAKQTYYLVTDRGFAERGLRRMRVFGPRDVELK